MRLKAVLVALAFVPSPSAWAVAAPPAIRFERAPGGALAVQIYGKVDAPLEAVESVLLDIRRYPEWVPRLSAARASAAEAEKVVFESVFDLPWPVGTIRETVQMT